MKLRVIFRSFFVLCMLWGGQSQAFTKNLRWTEVEDKNPNLEHIAMQLMKKSGYFLQPQDFVVVEDRNLATSHFRMWAQVVQGTVVRGAGIRHWTNLQNGDTIQLEASLEDPVPLREEATRVQSLGLDDAFTVLAGNALARKTVLQHEDHVPYSLVKTSREWHNGELMQIVRSKARRGYHEVMISVSRRKVVQHDYKEFPNADIDASGDEFSIAADLFPIFEEAESVAPGVQLPRERVQLKYIKQLIREPGGDPYAPLRAQRYFEDKYDPVLGATSAGQAQGYWSMASVKSAAARIRESRPMVLNHFKTGGVLLEGRYATINIHAEAIKKFSGLNFTPEQSLQMRPSWTLGTRDGEMLYEMIPTSDFLGKKILSPEEALARPARRLENHDPVSYMNDGFDELQVYYSVNTFMDSLRGMGMTDPELSTRPFHAFLYDPDISMRDNAYYTDDTINFTTYSPKAPNYARDNSTIWHELGHGIMDRLMGDSVVLADTGGLSEGMADFLAALVIADVMEGKNYPGMNDYRIMNKTGFFLTNEVHDDGEAYGGAMGDLKDNAIAAQGRLGLQKVTDLTMETMRLTRNNPKLTAQGWFEHMLFADSRGSAIRQKGEMSAYILAALNGRNFSLDKKVKLASMSLSEDEREIESGKPGSRQSPIRLNLAPGEISAHTLSIALTDGDFYKFQYPVTIKVFFRSGPLQGAIHWMGEENEPLTITLSNPGDVGSLPLAVSGTCDAPNRPDGSCVDYAYVQVWNNDPAATKPAAKKRYYLAVKTLDPPPPPAPVEVVPVPIEAPVETSPPPVRKI